MFFLISFSELFLVKIWVAPTLVKTSKNPHLFEKKSQPQKKRLHPGKQRGHVERNAVFQPGDMLVFGGVTFLGTEAMMEITSVFCDTKALGELFDEARNSWEKKQELKHQFTRCFF